MANQVRYSKKIAKFICDHVADGMTVAEICDRKFKDITPDSRTVYKWRPKHPEFDEQLHQAYETHFLRKYEEMEEITQKSAKELYPDLEFKEAAEARRARLDVLKFALGKMAPVLARRTFSSKVEVEHSGEVKGPTIQIMSYSKPIVDAIDGELGDLKKIDTKKGNNK